MENYNLEEEKKEHPYRYYGRVEEEKHGDARFLKKTALRYVIDAYDDYLCSVEDSHYDELGYYEITNFSFDGEEVPEELDLTWMRKKDVFVLDDSGQYRLLTSIRANVDNIAYSYLPITRNPHKVLLIVNGFQTELPLVKQVRAIIKFITHNYSYLEGITFEGYAPIIVSLLSAYAKRFGIATLDEERKIIRK